MSPPRLFTDDQIAEIRAMRQGGALLREIASSYGTTPCAISRICTGKRYKETTSEIESRQGQKALAAAQAEADREVERAAKARERERLQSERSARLAERDRKRAARRLTPEQVRLARGLFRGGMSLSSIAQAFGVPSTEVTAVTLGVTGHQLPARFRRRAKLLHAAAVAEGLA